LNEIKCALALLGLRRISGETYLFCVLKDPASISVDGSRDYELRNGQTRVSVVGQMGREPPKIVFTVPDYFSSPVSHVVSSSVRNHHRITKRDLLQYCTGAIPLGPVAGRAARTVLYLPWRNLADSLHLHFPRLPFEHCATTPGTVCS
jgi:hypothetical protein